MEITNRNFTIDIFRLIASLFIVFLHVGYGTTNEDIVAVIRIAGRWGVPFFFMLSGYFFQASLTKQPDQSLKKSLSKIVLILIISNIAYIFFQYLIEGRFNWGNIFPGTYFHLWFLPSLAVGTFSVYMFNKIRLTSPYVFSISVLVILLVLLLDSYSFILPLSINNLGGKVIPLLSVPFMNIGANFYKRNWSTFLFTYKYAALLIIMGFILQITEVKIIHYISGRSIVDHQYLIGTGILTAGIFILAFSLKIKNQVLGNWGKNYSLFIYLYHPALILLFYQLDTNTVITGNYILFFPVLIFILTLFIGIILNRFTKPVFKFLTGDIRNN